jgi:type I restriction enzyme S subunit
MTDEPLPLRVMAALVEDFAESDLPWKVDIVDWTLTGAPFRLIIESDRVLVQRGARQDSVEAQGAR